MQQEELLYRVAKLYYIQHRTQLEISKTLKTSRSTVSRLLQRAIDQKIVNIKISYPWRRNTAMEERLTAQYKLQDVRVLDADERSEEKMIAGVGVLAAQLLDQYVKDGNIIGVSYGRAVASTASALSQKRHVPVTIVPILGALGSTNNALDGPEMVRQLAQVYQSEYHYLPAPLLVKDQRSRDVLLRIPQINETLALAKRSNIVLVGIGDASHASPIWGGYLDRRGMEWVISRGAVGHMCGQFFDEKGQVLLISTNQRSISIGLDALRSIPKVLAVAGGTEKVAAIRAAIRGRFLNMLVTDAAAARSLLAEA